MKASKSPEQDKTAEIQKEIEKQFKIIRREMKKINERLDALEVHLEKEVSPYGQKVTPAVEETVTAIKKLTGPGQWVSLRQLSKETTRSLPTEATYVKYLYENRVLERRPSHSYSRTGRRVRIFVYRLKK